MSERNDTRGFEVRTIKTGDALGCAGYGLEIVDGGSRGGENLIIVGRGSYGTDQAYTDEASIRAWPGNKLISTFDYIRVAPTLGGGSVLDIDTMRVKVQTARNAVFTDAQRPGMTTKRNLARGITGSIAAGAATRIWESNSNVADVYRDDYYTDERLTEAGYFDGWTFGDVAHKVWILAARSRTPAGTTNLHPIVEATAQTRTLAAGIADGTHVGGFSYNFTWGQTSATSTVGIPVVYPGGAVEVWIENTSAGPGTFEYFLGLRGSL